VINVAERLDIKIKGQKAYCFSGHDKKTPSLSFEPKRNIWKCFGCGRGGNGLKLVMEVRSCSFKEAIDWFIGEFGLGIKRIHGGTSKRVPTKKLIIPITQKIQSVFNADTELYTWLIEKCGSVKAKEGQQYLQDHGISQNWQTASVFGN